MAHYAFLDENNMVTSVIAGRDEGELGIDWEEWYGNFQGQVCKRTSYNTSFGQHTLGGTPFRKNFATAGYTYDPIRDAFIPPADFPSWVLNEDKCIYEPPFPKPNDGKLYVWNEEITNWVEYVR